jgi:uncharacterized protein YgiB involved in biofilm formation
MKRSTALHLAIMGTLPAAALTGCSSEVQTPFATVADCTTAGHPGDQCQRAFDVATLRNKTSPLRYADQEASTCAPDGTDNPHYTPAVQGVSIIWKDDKATQAESATPLYRLRPGRSGGGAIASNLSDRDKTHALSGDVVADANAADFLRDNGSDEPGVAPKTYTSLSDCTDDGNSEETCSAAQAAAAADTKDQPTFADQSTCESQYNGCHQSGSSWVPFMVGYMLGHSNGSGYYHPVYTSRGGDYVSTRAGRTGTVSRTTISSRSMASSRAITASRNAFGSSSAARSSWGGGGHSSFGG